MGKGDKKTRKGKIIIGSYGVKRPGKTKKVKVGTAVAEIEIAEKPQKASKKPIVKDMDTVKAAVVTEKEGKTPKAKPAKKEVEPKATKVAKEKPVKVTTKKAKDDKEAKE